MKEMSVHVGWGRVGGSREDKRPTKKAEMGAQIMHDRIEEIIL